MLKTNLCQQLGMEYPIFSVGFDAGAGPELAAAVSNAGGCGVLGGSSFAASYLRERIQHLRQLTDRPFGVNLILDVIDKDLIDTCLAERVPILMFFWGDPRPYARGAHQHGVKVFIQVGSADEARVAPDAGLGAIIAQSSEVWEIIQAMLPDQRERRLAYLLYHCGLKPREIVRFCPQEWRDVQEIYRLRRSMLDRLVRSADQLRWRLSE